MKFSHKKCNLTSIIAAQTGIEFEFKSSAKMNSRFHGNDGKLGSFIASNRHQSNHSWS
jgi:hypothetical protein